jgi:hypothetical protein
MTTPAERLAQQFYISRVDLLVQMANEVTRVHDLAREVTRLIVELKQSLVDDDLDCMTFAGLGSGGLGDLVRRMQTAQDRYDAFCKALAIHKTAADYRAEINDAQGLRATQAAHAGGRM